MIEIIKNEKEDITKNLESMSSELLKYKAAYKKLVRGNNSKRSHSFLEEKVSASEGEKRSFYREKEFEK